MDDNQSNKSEIHWVRDESGEYVTLGYKLYLDGCDALREQNYNAALSLFLKSVAEQAHFKTYEKIYETLQRLGRDEEGLIYIEKAYELQPTNDKTATLYARTLVNSGKFEIAKEILETTLQRNPTYGPAKKLLDLLHL